jgi:hypothetical protein
VSEFGEASDSMTETDIDCVNAGEVRRGRNRVTAPNHGDNGGTADDPRDSETNKRFSSLLFSLRALALVVRNNKTYSSILSLSPKKYIEASGCQPTFNGLGYYNHYNSNQGPRPP